MVRPRRRTTREKSIAVPLKWGEIVIWISKVIDYRIRPGNIVPRGACELGTLDVFREAHPQGAEVGLHNVPDGEAIVRARYFELTTRFPFCDAVAVVIESVPGDFRCSRVNRGREIDAVAPTVRAYIRASNGEQVEVTVPIPVVVTSFVHQVVAVVVHVVAGFYCECADRRIVVVAISSKGCRESRGGIAHTDALSLCPGSVPIRVGVEGHTGFIGLFIGDSIAVVIDTVAELRGSGKNLGFERSTVVQVERPVAIQVRVALIPESVVIKVFLSRIGEEGTVVIHIENLVLIGIESRVDRLRFGSDSRARAFSRSLRVGSPRGQAPASPEKSLL